jgi:tape measure domain-containing protein
MEITRALAVTINPAGATAGAATASAAFDRVGAAARGMEQQTNRTTSSVSSLTSSLGFLKRALAGIGFGLLVRDLYQTDNAMTRLQNQLKYASGSAQEFQRNFSFVRAEAQKLGLNLKATGDAFGQFVAAAKGKLAGSQIREAFNAISEAAVTMGLSAEQTSGTIVALSQMLSKGTVSAQELRQQLGNSLPGAFQLAAQAMGLTEKEMNKAMDAGTIMADELVPRLAKKLHEAFGPSSIEGAKTLQAEMNRLKTAWTEVEMTFMSGGGESIFAKVLKSARGSLQELQSLIAAVFQASAEGRLSEALAASFRIGIGKAANYFAGFVKTAAEMLTALGGVLFTPDYFKSLVASFQAVGAAFGLALVDALQKPLAWVQAVLEKIASLDQSDAITRAQQYVSQNDPRFGGKTARELQHGPGIFGAIFRSKDEDQLLSEYRAAVAARRATVEGPDLTIEERARNIMSSGGPRFGFSGTGETIADLTKANNERLQSSVGALASGTADAITAALAKVKNFQPLNSVDTSQDESLLKGFANRSTNPWSKITDGAPEAAPKIPDKTFWTEVKRGIDDAVASLGTFYQRSYQIGTESVAAMSKGFDGFFDSIIDGTDSVSGAFRKMTASILSDIAKIITQQAVSTPIAGLIMSGVGALFGSFGAGTGASSAGLGSSGLTGGYDGTLASTYSMPISHSGGLVGLTLGSHKLVDPSVFARAPRLHNGLKPDEFPAILQRGEEVVPRGEAGRARNVTIPINVTVDGSKGGSPEQNQRMGAEVARQLKAMVRSVIVEEMMPRGILNPVSSL